MKIGMIFRKLNVKGGVQRQGLSLANELRRHGHEIIIYTFNYSPENCFAELVSNIPVVELPKRFHRPTDGFFGFLNESQMAKDLAFFIDKDLDILHPHDNVAHQVAYYFKKYIKDIPSVWQMNEFPTMRWPLELLKYTEDPKFHDIPKKPHFVKKTVILIKTYYENFFIRTQNAITVFDKFHQKLLERYSGCKSYVVPSGIEIGHLNFLKHEPPKKGEKILLLSSGIFMPYRRYEDIFYAMEKLVDDGFNPYLTIFGDYKTDKKYFRGLNELADYLKISRRIKFLGRYPDEALDRAFVRSHIFVYPHLQSQGLAVYEAMACGLPCIVTPLYGTYETLTDKKDAMFAKPKNPDSLAEAVKSLCENPELYHQISEQGRKTVERFSWGKYTNGILNVMEKVLKENSQTKSA